MLHLRLFAQAPGTPYASAEPGLPGAPRLLLYWFAKQSLSLGAAVQTSAQRLIFNLPVAPWCKGSCQGGVAVDWSALSPHTHNHGWVRAGPAPLWTLLLPCVLHFSRH